MLRMLFFVSVCLLVHIPHTSIQDVSMQKENRRHLAQQSRVTNNVDSIENLIRWLTEQQYQYEIAHYSLVLNNIFPNFAKLFHERSEQKYHSIRHLKTYTI